MMADMTQDDIALAAEYALGLLDSAGHASASARIATDAAFAAEVEAWRVRLQPMLDGADVPAPDHLWPAIAAKLPALSVQDNIKGRLRFWQMTSLGSGAVAAVLAGLLFLQPKPVPQTPAAPLVAALGSESGTASLTVRYDSKSGDMLLTPVLLDTGKLYPELWIIPADGKARSLGIVAGDHATQMVVPANMRVFMEQGATLAITPEPAGGAPGGKATGPIMASGKIIPV
jgi:anti-sigma-K factor RskA